MGWRTDSCFLKKKTSKMVCGWNVMWVFGEGSKITEPQMSTYQPLVPVNMYLTWQKELYRCNKLKDLRMFQIRSDQIRSVAQSCPTLCNPMNRSTPGLPVHHQLPEFTRLTSIESVMPSSHRILCRPLLPPSIPPSIRVFSNESALRMRWPTYWSFSFSIPSKEIPGLIFRMDCLDLLAVQGTLNGLLQYHSSKASILQHSAFFTVLLSHPYMTTGKTIALTR